MNIDEKLKVTEIQRFCMHDGPGVRTTVFLKGCPLRCSWCHNPETQKQESELLFYPVKCIGCRSCEGSCRVGAHTVNEEHFVNREICSTCFECVENCPTNALEKCGKDMSVDEILSVVKKDLAFYGDTGGITVSGGEPFLQKDGVIALLKACKSCGISTAVETCGFADTDVLRAAVPFVDLFLWDLKDTNDDRHKSHTGAPVSRILENLTEISQMGARIRLRCILVDGINTEEEHYRNIADIEKSIPNSEGIELIPYHPYGGTKAVFLGGNDNGNSDWIPDKSKIEYAKKIIRDRGATVI